VAEDARGKPARDHVSVKVTGEAQYQEALRRIRGRKVDEEIRLEGKMARLIPEPDNPYDSFAIRVESKG
jgi:hypothetical protein